LLLVNWADQVQAIRRLLIRNFVFID